MNKNQHTFEAKNIVTGYDKKIIIDGIDLSVPSNKVSVIIGSNGCGKSTLLKTMARLIKPLSGDIVIDGRYNCLGFSIKRKIPLSKLI